MTDSFQANKDAMQLLIQARAMRSALVKGLYCAFCAVFMGVQSSPPDDFLKFFQETVITTNSQMMQVVLFPPGEHLAFSGILIVSSPIFLLHKVFVSFLIRQRMELTLEMSFCPSFCTCLPKFHRC